MNEWRCVICGRFLDETDESEIILQDLINAGVLVEESKGVRLSFKAYKQFDRILMCGEIQELAMYHQPGAWLFTATKKLLKRYKLDDDKHVRMLLAYFEASIEKRGEEIGQG